jgi:hypothetical protein
MPADVPSETEQEGDARERFEAEATRRFPGVEFWWSNGERRQLRGSRVLVSAEQPANPQISPEVAT